MSDRRFTSARSDVPVISPKGFSALFYADTQNNPQNARLERLYPKYSGDANAQNIEERSFGGTEVDFDGDRLGIPSLATCKTAVQPCLNSNFFGRQFLILFLQIILSFL